MNVNVVVSQDGTLKVKNVDEMNGKEFHISAEFNLNGMKQTSSNAAKIMKLFEESDQMDFLRKTHDELIRELWEVRG